MMVTKVRTMTRSAGKFSDAESSTILTKFYPSVAQYLDIIIHLRGGTGKGKSAESAKYILKNSILILLGRAQTGPRIV